MADPSQVRLIPDCKVSVDGKKLDTEKDAALTRVEIDLDVDLFGQCTLIFNDPQQKLINGKDFESGTAIKVEIGFASKLQKVFEGEVVALEPQFRRDMPPSLRVVCQEGLHRLALSQMTRAFNDVDDKEIANKIAQEHGLSADAPSGTKEHILQGNVTDATFLRRLAQKHGNHLRIEGKKLIIGPPASGATITVGPGDGLRKVKVRVQSNTQVEEITVHGYDPKTKQEFVGKAKGTGVVGEGTQKYGKGKTLSFAGHEHQPADQATAEAMAKGRMRKIAEGHVVATLETIGNPGMIPGATVKLEKMGAQIDGSYRVEKALHHFSKHGYYVNLKAVRVAKASPPAAKAAAAPAAAQSPAPAPAAAAGGAQAQAPAAAQTPAAAPTAAGGTAAAQGAAGTGAAPAQAATGGTGATQAQAAQTAATQSTPAAAGAPQPSLSTDAKSPQVLDAPFNLKWTIQNWAQGMTATLASDQDIGDGKTSQDITSSVQSDGSGTLTISPPSGGAFNSGTFSYVLTVTPQTGDPVKSAAVAVTVQAEGPSASLKVFEGTQTSPAGGASGIQTGAGDPIALHWEVSGAASVRLTAEAIAGESMASGTVAEGKTKEGGRLWLDVSLDDPLPATLRMFDASGEEVAYWEIQLEAERKPREPESDSDFASLLAKKDGLDLTDKLDASGNGKGDLVLDHGPGASCKLTLTMQAKDSQQQAKTAQVTVNVASFNVHLKMPDGSLAPPDMACKLELGLLAGGPEDGAQTDDGTRTA
ncbi:MAG: phage late control D family protein [Myxococcales bacterium]